MRESMKRLLLSALTIASLVLPAAADYRMIIPQDPPHAWSEVIMPELSKKLGETIVNEYIPGPRNIPGINKWHKSERFDNKAMAVIINTNATAFLIENTVDYDYKYYDLIALQNVGTMTHMVKGFDPYSAKKIIAVMNPGPGSDTSMMAATMLVCGPKANMQSYLDCWKEKFNYVKGMKGSEQNLALRRGEINVAATGIAGWFEQFKTDPCCEPWFVDSIYNLATGKDAPDPNFPGKSFEELYRVKWKQAPAGDLYEAYLLAHKWRDTLQKSVWINRGNPNTETVRKAMTNLLNDKEAVDRIDSRIGKYGWIVGNDGEKVMANLRNTITEKSYKNLIWWFNNAYGIEAVYKPELVKK